MRTIRTVLLFACLGVIAVGAWFAWARAMKRPAISVIYMVPHEFEGPFVVCNVTGNSPGNSELMTQTGSNYVIQVPRSGLAIVPNTKMLNIWHRAAVATQDGMVIPVTSRVDAGKATGNVFVALGSTYGDDTSQYWYYFGPVSRIDDKRALDELGQLIDGIRSRDNPAKP